MNVRERRSPDINEIREGQIFWVMQWCDEDVEYKYKARVLQMRLPDEILVEDCDTGKSSTVSARCLRPL